MKSFNSLVLVLALGLGALIGVPAPAADPASPEKINKLIEKMGSGEFEDREKATEELDAIGIPALEALRKAIKSEDPEVRRRSEELVAKIDKRVESVKVLAPTKVRLIYKDTPVADAVKDFAKKSGYQIAVMDPQGKLKARTMSLDTGEVSFWQAFDVFCREAGLVEADLNDIIRLQPQPPNPFGLPPGALVPQGGIKVPIRGVPVPLPAPVPGKPIEEKPPQRVPNKEQEQQVQQAPAQQAVPGIAVARLQVQARPALQPGGQPAQIVLPPGGAGILGAQGGFGMPFQAMPPANQITLIDGKAKIQPTDYSSAVRVRPSDHIKQQGQAPADEVRVGLQLTPEPKLQMQQVVSVRVSKAVDDQDQKLVQIMNMGQGANPPPVPGFGIGGFGGVPMQAWGFAGFQGMPMGGAQSHYPMIQFKKGEKASKTLKELSGVLTAQVLAPATPAITVDNLMKMAGKEVKGKDGGLIKVVEVKRAANDQLMVRFEFEGAGNAGNPFGAVPGVLFPAPNIRIFPAPPPVPVQPPMPPVKNPAPKKPLQQGQAQPGQPQPAQEAKEVQVQAQPVRAQAQIQIQIGGPVQIGPGGFGFFGMPQAGNNGFTLVDAKGNTLQPIAFNQQLRQNGNVLKVEQVLTFQLQKGQEPAKLVYSTSKSTTIDIPFTLKDVVIP